MDSATTQEEGRRPRKRPGTKAIRLELKSKLEKAISESDYALLKEFHLGGDGSLVAPLPRVMARVGLDRVPTFAVLSPFALKSISNVTRMFKIVDAPEGGGGLQICVDGSVREVDGDERKVYVDNLPPGCSEDQLRRRASLFGSVVGVSVPQIARLQRQYTGSTLNSGFAFIEFATKHAARRFVRKYAMSSRLRRTKHSHKRKGIASKKSREEIVGAGSLGAPAPAEKNDGSSAVAPPPHQRSTTSLSATMSVDDSGTETETEAPSAVGGVMEATTKKRSRKRRARDPSSGSAQKENLARKLRRMQVFPMKAYKEMRSEYLKLQREQFSLLKTELRQQQVDGTNRANQPKAVTAPFSSADGTAKNKRKRKRGRGKQRLMMRAEQMQLQNSRGGDDAQL